MPQSIVENIDCMLGMSRYPDKHFDLAIVDPPYGIGEDGRNTNGRTLKKDGSFIYKVDKRNGRQIAIKPKGYKLGNWDNNCPTEEYFSELKRVSKNQIIWGVNNYPVYLGKGRIFWDKCNAGSDFSDGELAYCSLHDSIRKVVFMWLGFKQGKSLSEGSTMQGNNKLWEKRIHPCHKPIALYMWLLQNYAVCKKCKNEGGFYEDVAGDGGSREFVDCEYCDVATDGVPKILDTHLGSGSSRIAAYDMGFDFTGFELDADYFAAQEKRFAEHVIKNGNRMFQAEQPLKVEQIKLL